MFSVVEWKVDEEEEEEEEESMIRGDIKKWENKVGVGGKL